jgi:hypothetical protein
MGKRRIAVLASGTMLLVGGWLPLVATTVVVGGGGAMLTGCAGKSDTRQDTRTEQRTEERMENRRD